MQDPRLGPRTCDITRPGDAAAPLYVAPELRAALATWWRETPRYGGKSETNLEQLDGRIQDMLRALGYLE